MSRANIIVKAYCTLSNLLCYKCDILQLGNNKNKRGNLMVKSDK